MSFAFENKMSKEQWLGMEKFFDSCNFSLKLALFVVPWGTASITHSVLCPWETMSVEINGYGVVSNESGLLY